LSRILIVALALLLVGLSAAPAADARTFGSRVLKKGMSGSYVRTLQNYLTRVGHRTGADGHFGRQTKLRVKAWKRGAGLKKTHGVVTKRNARKLRRQVESGGASYVEATDESAPAGKARIGRDGKAIPPADAPAKVKAVIEAANKIHDKPYRYGGGHGQWEDSGYDCSGSVSYALRGGGFVKSSMPSGGYTSWGVAGKGKWITTYAHGGHMYMVVAGLRFDTSGAKARGGSRWTTEMRSASGFTARHPKSF
jgi:hypothetical protein